MTSKVFQWLALPLSTLMNVSNIVNARTEKDTEDPFQTVVRFHFALPEDMCNGWWRGTAGRLEGVKGCFW